MQGAALLSLAEGHAFPGPQNFGKHAYWATAYAFLFLVLAGGSPVGAVLRQCRAQRATAISGPHLGDCGPCGNGLVRRAVARSARLLSRDGVDGCADRPGRARDRRLGRYTTAGQNPFRAQELHERALRHRGGTAAGESRLEAAGAGHRRQTAEPDRSRETSEGARPADGAIRRLSRRGGGNVLDEEAVAAARQSCAGDVLVLQQLGF